MATTIDIVESQLETCKSRRRQIKDCMEKSKKDSEIVIYQSWVDKLNIEIDLLYYIIRCSRFST